MYHLAAGSMGGVVHEGLVFVNHRYSIKVALKTEESSRRLLLSALENGVDGSEDVFKGHGPTLVEALADTDMLLTSAADRRLDKAVRLTDAIRNFQIGIRLPLTIITSEEALILSEGLNRAEERKILRAFIAGHRNLERMMAYAYQVSAAAQTVYGDWPETGSLVKIHTTSPDPGAVLVLNLLNGKTEQYVIDEILHGWEKSGRLQAITASWSPEKSFRSITTREYASFGVITTSLRYELESVCIFARFRLFVKIPCTGCTIPGRRTGGGSPRTQLIGSPVGSGTFWAFSRVPLRPFWRLFQCLTKLGSQA